jgi:hypothetical protein
MPKCNFIINAIYTYYYISVNIYYKDEITICVIEIDDGWLLADGLYVNCSIKLRLAATNEQRLSVNGMQLMTWPG